MTKNLFLLFSFYFFVVQALIVGLLTGNILFYQLAAINTGAMLFIILLYFLFTKPVSEEGVPAKKAEKEVKPLFEEEVKPKPSESEVGRGAGKEKPLEEKKENFSKIVQPLPPAPKKRKRSWTGSQWWIFLITLIITIAIHFIICEFLTYRSPVISLLIGYLLFVTIGKLCSLNGFESTGKLITTRVYLLLILLAGAYAGGYQAEKGDFIEAYIPVLWETSSFPFLSGPEKEKPEVNTGDPSDRESAFFEDFEDGEYIYEGSGEVLSGSREKNPSSETVTPGDFVTGSVATGSSVTTGTTQQGDVAAGTGVVKEVSMMEAVKHVITTNAIPLSRKTDISFTTLSKSHADYAYFITAYEKRMIGKNTEPNKQISCDTYMVIKGLGEGWNVGNYSDVKAAYWKKAEELKKLNGCKKGGWVTTATL